jgi:hypothetical protein
LIKLVHDKRSCAYGGAFIKLQSITISIAIAIAIAVTIAVTIAAAVVVIIASS